MTIFDASVLVDALVVVGPAGDDARDALRDVSVLRVPSIFPAEVVSAIRSLHARDLIDDGRAAAARARVASVRTLQYAFEPFLDRVWELRHNLSVYDGWYIALAESLDTTLVTADRRLAEAPGPRCPVVYTTRFVTGSSAPEQRARPGGGHRP